MSIATDNNKNNMYPIEILVERKANIYREMTDFGNNGNG